MDPATVQLWIEQPCSSKSADVPAMFQPPDFVADDHEIETTNVELEVCRARQKQLYPWMNFEDNPLPTKWWSPSNGVKLSDGDLKATFDRSRKSAKKISTKGGAQSNHSIPPTCKIYYFEVYVEELGEDSLFYIGCGDEWSQNSTPTGIDWSTHGLCSNGFYYESNGDGVEIFNFGRGDTIGCGVDFVEKKIFFTKNGVIKVEAASRIIPHQMRFNAKIGFEMERTGHRVVIKANFGQQQFLFPIEQELKNLEIIDHNTIGQFDKISDPPTLTDEEFLKREEQVAKFCNGTEVQTEDLPWCWNVNERRYNLKVSGQGHLIATFLGPVNYLSMEKTGKIETRCAAAVRANKPIPPNIPFYYFEVKILHGGGMNGRIAMGVGLKEASLGVPLGTNDASMAYRSDQRALRNSKAGVKWAEPFEAGDVVGCGLNRAPKKKGHRTEIFFTKNGKYLGYGWYELVEEYFYPMVSFLVMEEYDEKGEEVKVNFGQEPFMFDIDNYMRDEVDIANLECKIKAELSAEILEGTLRTSCAVPKSILRERTTGERKQKRVRFNLPDDVENNPENLDTNDQEFGTAYDYGNEVPEMPDGQPSYWMRVGMKIAEDAVNNKRKMEEEYERERPHKLVKVETQLSPATSPQNPKQPTPPTSPIDFSC